MTQNEFSPAMNRAEKVVCQQPTDSAPEHNFQADYIAKKFRISPCLARVICELAHIGGRLI